MEKNQILLIQKRYLKAYKDSNPGQERQLISIEDMARIINSELNIRDKAIITLLAKTGIMRNELSHIKWLQKTATSRPWS